MKKQEYEREVESVFQKLFNHSETDLTTDSLSKLQQVLQVQVSNTPRRDHQFVLWASTLEATEKELRIRSQAEWDAAEHKIDYGEWSGK